MADFLFRGALEEVDADVFNLTQLESERQARKIILIPSESQAPFSVREAVASTFQNIYAEGYPDEDTRFMDESELMDFDTRLTHYRRYSDPRYYKGVEYADLIEALARRRVAEVFANEKADPDAIFVNVQALSGAPANSAVYHALINPGDTIMGMTLSHGGHLSHGSPVNRSGKIYHSVSYSVDSDTEMINYQKIEELAILNKPKVIIAGFSSYPWTIDWEKFQTIARKVGAFLLADIAHIAGLVAAKVIPSPLGYADIITFTTHKSLCGPRGACILTQNPILARKIDRAVFPGEQGGPHINSIAGIAVAMKLAKTDQFKKLQEQIISNSIFLTNRLKYRGFRIPYGGTNTHLSNLDCSSIIGPDGTRLSGDQAARILDIAGIVVNRNTIPGDVSAVDPSGIRLGTPWVTQRGFKEDDMVVLADLIADLIQSIKPFSINSRKGDLRRAKVDFSVLEEVKLKVKKLAENHGLDFTPQDHSYPHFYYINDQFSGKFVVFEISGDKALPFLDLCSSNNIAALKSGESQDTQFHTPLKCIQAVLTCLSPRDFQITVDVLDAGVIAAWLRDLSDGYVSFDEDLFRKIPGPVSVRKVSSGLPKPLTSGPAIDYRKPYFIGMGKDEGNPHKEFIEPLKEISLQRTPIYETHHSLNAKIIPFAGWEMPVWYSSVVEEHLAVRQTAGLFDVTHMGVYQVEGIHASVFLDFVVCNDIGSLKIGESCYTHLLDLDANVIDDLLVYYRSSGKYLMVVNASNDHKDWAWLNSIKNGEVKISRERPSAQILKGDVRIRNLKNIEEGEDMRVDIALQGPKSRDILLALGASDVTKRMILTLKRTELCEANIGGYDLVVSRTGYTGEKMAFELFVHPSKAEELFNALLVVGRPLGLKPIGLGARDSLRTEAGLPLYGHEMGVGSGHRGEYDLGVSEAGFGSYVKTYKPWFIGREAYIRNKSSQKGIIVRFKFNEKGIRMAHQGDPVVERKGKTIGYVTSCAIDKEGFLTGMAFVDLKYSEEGNQIFIFQGASNKPGQVISELRINEKVVLPAPASVISRFPKL